MSEEVKLKFDKLNKLWTKGIIVISMLISIIVYVNTDTKGATLHNDITPMIEQACFTAVLQENTIKVDGKELTVLVEYNPIGTYEDTVKYSLDISTNQAESYEHGEIGKCSWLVNSYNNEDNKLSEGLMFYELNNGMLTIAFIYNEPDNVEFVKSIIENYSDNCENYLQSQQVLKTEVDENVN